MLDRIEKAECEGGDQVSFDEVLSEIGRRAFGPLLLFPGVITLMPIVGGTPGVPIVMGVVVLLVAAQLLVGKQTFWFPDWILRRSVPREKLKKPVRWMRPPARFVDRFLRPRLTQVTEGAGGYAIAVVCTVIALAMPPMELVPFSVTGAGVALTLFGLALMANDGYMAVAGFVFTAITLGLVVYGLV